MARNLSKITLYQGVELDKTYKNVVDFNRKDDFDNWLNSHPNKTMTASYQSLNKPIRWDSKILSFNQVINYNYVRIEQADDVNNENFVYYGFITNDEYLDDGCTHVYFSIDMFQTYKYQVNYSHAFIKRAFVKELTDDGTDFTKEFKLIKNNKEDIGGDGCENLLYSNKCYFLTKQGDPDGVYYDDTAVKFVLFTAQPKDAKTENGTLLGAYSQYKYYVLAYNPASRTCFDIYNNGNKVITTAGTTIDAVYKELSSDTALVGSNSLVVDSEIYSYIGIPFELTKDGKGVNFKVKDLKATAHGKYLFEFQNAPLDVFKPQYGIAYRGKELAGSNVLQGLVSMLRARYGNDAPIKLLGEPFMKCYFTNGKGAERNADFLTFNTLNTDNLKLYRFGGISENGREMYAVLHYSRANVDDAGLPVTYENAQMIDDSARDVPIILDSYTEFLNANRNQLNNTRANAKMNERLAKEGNAISLGNTERNMRTARNVQQYQQGRAKKMAGYEVLGDTLTGVAKGGLLGGISGAIGGAIDYAKLGYNQNTQAESLAMQQATQNENARINYAYQNEVATNNYEQTIRSQNAMLADTKNHNDQVAHEGSAYLYDYQVDNNAMHWQIFSCQDAVMYNAKYYFLLFGYVINQYGAINDYLHRKNKFNYVLVSNANVTGSVNPAVIDFFNKMFESGVTFWNPMYIGDFIDRNIDGNQFN